MASILLALLIIVPIIEIYLFIEIGGAIGAGWTILLILATAIIGMATMRAQGMATLAEAQAAQARGRAPLAAVGHGVLILLGGALLLTPGFFTDALGFTLMLRWVRGFVLETVLALFIPQFMHGVKGFGGFQGGAEAKRAAQDTPLADIIEGDFRVEDDETERGDEK